jgi:hypothetical protein
MSTYQPPRDNRSATKRRAERRKRNREIGRQIFAYGVVALLVLGTVSSVFVSTVGVPGTGATITPPTATVNNAFQQLVTLGDQSLLNGDPVAALSFYRAYLSENPGDTQVQAKLDGVLGNLNTLADQAISANNWVSATTYLDAYTRDRGTDAAAQLKYARALLSKPDPDYVKAGTALERAMNIPGSTVAAEAQALLAQNQVAIATAVAASPVVTGTIGLTSTVSVTSTVGVTSTTIPTGGTVPTSTVPLTPTRLP